MSQHSVDIGVFLTPLLQATRCQECSCDGMSVTESGKRGLASTFSVACRNCGWTLYLPTSSRTATGTIEVNRRAVYAFRQIGQGLTGIEKCCGTMNMPPPMSYNSYSEHVKGLNVSTSAVAEKTMADAAMDIRSAANRQPENNASDPPVHCSVYVDGSWQRRGYCSLNGIVTAMSLPEEIDRPGKVLDVAV